MNALRRVASRALAHLAREVASFLPERVIRDREGGSPYLSRFYIVGRPTMPDGSEPFDELGAPKFGAEFPDGWGLYLHHFHRSDDAGDLHSHPWEWSMSLVLSGGYSEERRIGNYVVRRDVLPLSLNRIYDTDFHRVDLHADRFAFETHGARPPLRSNMDEVWTLFLAGSRVTDWGFWNRLTRRYLPHREYFRRAADRQRAEAS